MSTPSAGREGGEEKWLSNNGGEGVWACSRGDQINVGRRRKSRWWVCSSILLRLQIFTLAFFSPCSYEFVANTGGFVIGVVFDAHLHGLFEHMHRHGQILHRAQRPRHLCFRVAPEASKIFQCALVVMKWVAATMISIRSNGEEKCMREW